MRALALAQAGYPGGAGTPAWVPALVGIVLGLGFLAVVILALVQRSRRTRARLARPRCGQCGQPLAAAGQGPQQCASCGWKAPAPPGELEFIYGPLQGQTFRLEAHITTIGSQGGNTIVIPDPAVSRKHVGIRRDAAGYELADLGSTNGVYVNGQRTAKRLLGAGDIIRVGASEMVFQLEKVG
jgi:hypothetical protein